jgi:trk system potassium uptake protein TrkA
MKFVIVGFGRVGMRTARILKSEGHEVVVVEIDPEKIELARGEGFDAIEGDGEDERVLERAGLDDADAIAGLSGDLNVNFAACMVGIQYGLRTVLRIDEDYRQEIYEKYAADVDEIIYPERLGAAGAKNALLGGDLNVLAALTETMTATTVDIPDDSPLIGLRVVEVEWPEGARVYAHGHAKEPMTIPLPQTQIKAGDQLALIAEQGVLEAVRAQIRGEATPA